MNRRVSVWKYVRVGKKWRYCKPSIGKNGKIKPDLVIVKGRDPSTSFLMMTPRGSVDICLTRQSPLVNGYRNVPVEDPSVTVSGNKEELAEQQVQIAPSLLSSGRSNQRGSVKDVPEHFVKDVMRLDIPPYWRGLVFCFPPALAGTVTDVLATLCKGCHVTEHLKAQP
jgi:hypothetical protein